MESFVKDRFTRGLLAGVVAGIITKIYDLLAFMLGMSTLRWLDFGGILIFGRRPISIGEQVFATVGTFFFHGLLGIIFVFLVQRLISSDRLLLKGWFYGVSCWFLIYAITILFKVPEITYIPLKTSLSNFVGASIWGIILAAFLVLVDKRIKL